MEKGRQVTLPFDDVLSQQSTNPDLCIGPDGRALDERLLPRGASKLRNSKHKKNILENGGDELEAALRREQYHKKKHEEEYYKVEWLKDEQKRNSFIEMCDLGATNDELQRSFPSLEGSNVALSIAKKRCGISKDRFKKARELRSIRELDKAKKDIENGTASASNEDGYHIKLSDGKTVYPDGTPVSTGKLEITQSRKRHVIHGCLSGYGWLRGLLQRLEGSRREGRDRQRAVGYL